MSDSESISDSKIMHDTNCIILSHAMAVTGHMYIICKENESCELSMHTMIVPQILVLNCVGKSYAATTEKKYQTNTIIFIS